MSPALVAEYQTRLPDKGLLQAKLHEFYELVQQRAALPALEDGREANRPSSKPTKRRKNLVPTPPRRNPKSKI